jgi:hypothetical protein
MKKIARSLRQHRELILNYFRAQKLISSGVVEGLNNKAKVTMKNPTAFAPTVYSNSPFITRLASCPSRNRGCPSPASRRPLRGHLYSRSFRLLHLFDTIVVVDLVTFPARLKAAGFSEVQVDVTEPDAFRFRARKSIAIASEANGSSSKQEHPQQRDRLFFVKVTTLTWIKCNRVGAAVWSPWAIVEGEEMV